MVRNDGAGHAEQGGVESNTHAGQGGKQTAAHIVQGVFPVGGAAQQLGQGGDGQTQAQEGTQQAHGDKQGNGIVQKPLAEQAEAHVVADGAADNGGGVGLGTKGFVGDGEIL